MMHNPPHPGEVLYGLHMEPQGLTINKVAERIGVDRKTLSRIINGHCSVSVDMAIRLGKAFNTTPDLWLGMQQDFDLWHAMNDKKEDLSFIKPFPIENNDSATQ